MHSIEFTAKHAKSAKGIQEVLKAFKDYFKPALRRRRLLCISGFACALR